MRKPLSFLAKLVMALLSVAGMALLMFEGWLIWHYEYGIGLPNERKLATLSAAGPACSADDQRTYIPLSEIPPLIRQAAVVYEEPEFYERPSPNPLIEFVVAITSNRLPPPSGITIWVTRCLGDDCCRGANLDRQISQLVLMNRVARTFSRDRILEIYLNENYYGRGSYGVGAASIAYFDKPLGLLSVDEIAMIAALPRMPALINRRNDIARDRRNAVIDRMLQAKIINDAEAATARARPLQFRETSPDNATQQRKL